jgi:hypothetical protein
MRFWDNDIDRQIDEALDEMMREERERLAQGYTDEEIEEMYQAHKMRTDIGNPMKLYGAI